MKTLEVDDDVYSYIASNTRQIGETASSILKRLLGVGDSNPSAEASKVEEHEFKAFLDAGKLMYGSDTDKFLRVLAEAHRQKPNEFAIALEIRGRDRIYFARTSREISDSGNSTHPKQIPSTRYWVMTNSKTHQKKTMLRQVLAGMRFSQAACNEVCKSL